MELELVIDSFKYEIRMKEKEEDWREAKIIAEAGLEHIRKYKEESKIKEFKEYLIKKIESYEIKEAYKIKELMIKYRRI